jgi:hypothetical protein
MCRGGFRFFTAKDGGVMAAAVMLRQMSGSRLSRHFQHASQRIQRKGVSIVVLFRSLTHHRSGLIARAFVFHNSEKRWL